MQKNTIDILKAALKSKYSSRDFNQHLLVYIYRIFDENGSVAYLIQTNKLILKKRSSEIARKHDFNYSKSLLLWSVPIF